MKIQISIHPCKRGCGKTIASTSRSLYGANEAHRKYSGICSNCITKEEDKEINQSQLNEIIGIKCEK